MNIALIVSNAALLALVVYLLVERRKRARPRTRVASAPRLARRQAQVEACVQDVLEETRRRFGDVFEGYRVWKVDGRLRLELHTTPVWKKLSEYTRCIVLRQIWRELEVTAEGAVVIADTPQQRWSGAVDATFSDYGIDPWKSALLIRLTALQ